MQLEWGSRQSACVFHHEWYIRSSNEFISRRSRLLTVVSRVGMSLECPRLATKGIRRGVGSPRCNLKCLWGLVEALYTRYEVDSTTENEEKTKYSHRV
ncbi:hypothetical protein PISMIDRAFT_279680 [Pisolithus microcarpus 441]|uniref:Uncharacterized protein n=1 Tax=Pisolithus microcarpus 441 TaxID=765257 RepID=A0A0C9Z840_9AGAM|nr:hypothetical protein PISMIDRAFT_279680 [Pisolithus microcarpus 441]